MTGARPMIFPSAAWIAAVVAHANRHPDLAAGLRGLGRDLAVVIEADPPALAHPFAAYVRHEGGQIVEARALADPDEIWELEPAYVLRAPLRVWKKILHGQDVLQAAMRGGLEVEGDLQALVRRAQYRYVVEAALAGIATEFADAQS